MQRRNRARTLGTIGQAVAFAGLGWAYLFPDEFVRLSQANPERSSIIVFIEQLTVIPVWGYAFLAASLWLTIALIAKRKTWKAYAHLYTASITVGYAIASLATGIVNQGTFISGFFIASAVAVANIALMYSYGSAVDKLPVEDDDEDVPEIDRNVR